MGFWREEREPVAVVTSARRSRVADIDERRRRYVIVMLVRTLCVGLLIVLPVGWWSIVIILGGTFLPWVAVTNANAGPRRPLGQLTPYDGEALLALPAGAGTAKVIDADLDPVEREPAD